MSEHKNSNREQALLKNTLILSLGTFVPKAVSFVTLPILTASLSKEEYGTYDLILVLVSLILPAATLQIQTAAFRFLIKYRNCREKQEAIITNIFVFSSVVSVVALIVMFFFLGDLHFDTRVIILLYFLSDIFNNTCLQVVRGLGENFSYAIGAIVGSVGKIVLTVVGVLWFQGGLKAAILALIVATSFSALYIVAKSRLYSMVHIQYVSKKQLNELIGYSWPMVPNSMSMWVMNLSDRLVITSVLGLEANAIYAVANKIPSILSFAQSTFTMAWQENAALSSEDKDASIYYSKMFRVLFDMMAGFLALLIAMNPILFRILVRGEYSQAYFQSTILFLGMFFSSISAYLGGIYVAYMKTKSVGMTTMAAAIINLLMDILLVSKIGITAGSISTTVSYLFLVVFRMIDVRKLVAIKYDIKRIIRLLIVLLLMCLISSRATKLCDIVNVFIGFALFWMLNKEFIYILAKKLRQSVCRNSKTQ